MKKVLLISYAYPPISSPGAVRATRMAKHLSQYGWQSSILTVQDGFSQRIGGLADPLSDTPDLVFRVGDPIAKINTKLDGSAPNISQKKSFKHKFKSNIKSRLKSLLFPGRTVLWSQACRKWAKSHTKNYDIIYSTSPTPSTHLIGYMLARKNNVPWIAEFRDPLSWLTKDDTASKLRRWALKKYEKWVVTRATTVVVVSDTFQTYFETLYPDANIVSIPNGAEFNVEDLEITLQEKAVRKEKRQNNKAMPYRIVHTGALYGDLRPTTPIIKAVKSAMETSDLKFELIFAGNDAHYAVEAAEALGCANIVTNAGTLSHAETIKLLKTADVTLSLLINEELGKISIMSKFLDYLPAGAPILNLGGSDYILSQIISNQAAGASFEYTDINGMAAWLQNLPNASEPDTKRLCNNWSAERMVKNMRLLFETHITKNMQ